MRILFVLSFFYLTACGQANVKPSGPNPQARRLRDSASRFFVSSPDQLEQVIALLDQSTAIDSNYAVAFSDKITYQLLAHRHEEALGTTERLARLFPKDPKWLLTGGTVHQALGRDTEAKARYTHAIKLIDAILDTLPKKADDYVLLQSAKGMALVLNDQEAAGQKLLQQLLSEQTNPVQRQFLQQFVGKDKSQLLDMFLNGGSETQSVDAIPSDQ
jgi:tetratricopeptide (TPR) repeat protein